MKYPFKGVLHWLIIHYVYFCACTLSNEKPLLHMYTYFQPVKMANTSHTSQNGIRKFAWFASPDSAPPMLHHLQHFETVGIACLPLFFFFFFNVIICIQK